MHAIGALVYKHGDRRVRARDRNVLRHFLHDERVADKKPDDSRCLLTRFFLQNRALVKLHKQHQSCFAQTFLNCTFQFGKTTRLVSRSPKFSQVRMTDGGVHASYYFIERLGSRQTEPLYLNFSYHFESLYAKPL